MNQNLYSNQVQVSQCTFKFETLCSNPKPLFANEEVRKQGPAQAQGPTAT